jgi:hypothetical protein
MKRSILNALVAVAFAFQVLPASASTLTTWLTSGPNTSVSGATTFDFGTSGVNNSAKVSNLATTTVGIATFSGGELFNTSTAGVSGQAARPVGSTGNFWAIEPGETGLVTFTDPVKYYGFLWGSPDRPATWNEVTFYNGNTILGQFDGSITGLNNDWTSTVYFNVSTGNGPGITSITFKAGSPAFETDNHAFVSAVPLPAAAWLFGSALLGFVSLSNRRKI